MYKILIIIMSLILLCNGSGISEKLMNLRKRIISKRLRYLMDRRRWNKTLRTQNLPNYTNFCPIPMNYDKLHVTDYLQLADQADEKDYPWIARVFHSKTEFRPFICTAAAVKDKVFVTAGACLATSKVAYTSVHYQDTRLSTKAFVMREHSQRSQQLFDDLGLIVVEGNVNWHTIKPVSRLKRTGDGYAWFEELGLGKEPKGYAVGFVATNLALDIQRLFKLDKLYAGVELCHRVVQPINVTENQYNVPCYHPYTANVEVTKRYLRGLGHIFYIIENNEPRLVGVATWSCGVVENYLPIGISVPNADYYVRNLDCAEKISKSNLVKGFQALCESSLYFIYPNVTNPL